MALRRSLYIKATCRNDLCNILHLDSCGTNLFSQIDLAVVSNHSRAHTAASRCALKVCEMNSSAMLNVFPFLSTNLWLMKSCRLRREPVWLGLPQNACSTTLAHSHGKWKSPVSKIWFLLVECYYFYLIFLCYLDVHVRWCGAYWNYQTPTAIVLAWSAQCSVCFLC